MLEIIALCSCACLACLWCALAFEVARSKRGGRWTLRNAREWPWSRCKCVCHECVTGQTQGSPCENSHSPCACSPYKLVCKMCRRVKPECICAKVFWHNVAANRCANFQPASVSYNSFLPDLTCQETLWLSPKQVIPRESRSREHRSKKTKKAKNQRNSVPKSILRKKHTENENQDARKCCRL